MLKKRLIGVVTVRNGWAVQSFGYRRYLPLGRPECLVENLDRWGADEILLQVVDRSLPGHAAQGPDLELLRRVGRLGIGSPLVYGGGIRCEEDALQVVESGADRVLLDALLHDNPLAMGGISAMLGAQAVIGSLPLSYGALGLVHLNYRTGTSAPMSSGLVQMLASGLVSEVLVTDHLHEGDAAGFDERLVEDFPVRGMPLIAFGGISESEQQASLLGREAVSAIAVGNFLNYREHAVQRFKEGLTRVSIRPPAFESHFPLVARHAKN